MEEAAVKNVAEAYTQAAAAEDPKPEDLVLHDFAPSPITEEQGEREPAGKEKTLMVDCALFAVQELMAKHKECLLYGQDVGGRLGGVFREAATLAQKFGDNRVFNTPIQEAFIIGSTVGMSASGCKPIVEVQFADYIWPGLNQLFTEAAYYDPNPVIMLEHKGLYWSKIKGTEDAKTIEPDEAYVIPFGKCRKVQSADDSCIKKGKSLSIITYGMGVYWAKAAAKNFPSQIEIIDLRTLFPLDESAIYESVKLHSRCIVLTEEPVSNSFEQSLAGKISKHCFQYLDAAVEVIGSENLPAIPLNSTLEATMLPNADKVSAVIMLQQYLGHI